MEPKGSSAKASSGSKAVDEYFDRLPAAARVRLVQMRAIIRSAVPSQAVECISYSMPAFRFNGALVCYAAFKEHYSLFPMNARLVADLCEELAAYKTSKGTIQFPLSAQPPARLVRKIVKMRVAENQRRKDR